MIKIPEGFYEKEFITGKRQIGKIQVPTVKQRKFNKKDYDYHRSFSTEAGAKRKQIKAKKESFVNACITKGKNKNTGKKVYRVWIRR